MRVTRLPQATLAALLALPLLLCSCASTERAGANLSLHFFENHLVSPMLAADDLPMACIGGQSFAQVLLALGPTGLKADTDRLSVLLYAASAMCADDNALEEELRFMRASRQNRAEEAEDARINQLRWLAIASRRQYRSYQFFEHYFTSRYGMEIGEGCPQFSNELDEMTFMLGAISGLMAIVSDVNSENQVNVPKDIAGRAGRAMKCLDNEKWWGLPLAIQAAIWNIMPGGGPADPWLTMQQSMAIGRKEGVRVAYVVYALSAYAKDDQARLLDSFKAFAATGNDPQYRSSSRYRAFDLFSALLMRDVEDRYWTTHYGTRISLNDACFCASDTTAEPPVNIDDLK